MTTALWTGLVALILYLLASALAAQQLRSTGTPQRLGFLGLGTLALLFHACSLWHLIVSNQGVHLGLFPVASLIGATGVAIVILSNLYRRLEWVSLMVFPFNALFIAAALWLVLALLLLVHLLIAHTLLLANAFLRHLHIVPRQNAQYQYYYHYGKEYFQGLMLMYHVRCTKYNVFNAKVL